MTAATVATGHPKTTGPRRAPRVVAYVALLAMTVLFVAPLVWMAVTSFKTDPDAIAPDPTWIPPNPTTEGYEAILGAENAPVLLWFVNSLGAAIGQLVLVLVTASMAAYALARLEFAGKRLIFAAIVGTLFIPPVILLTPNFLIVDQLQWLDTLWAVIVPGAASAFGVFFLRQFFISLPAELEEAARLDGANQWQIFARVILPLSRPALATLALLTFLTSWNDFLWPLYVLFNPGQLTLPAGLSQLQSTYTTHYPSIMAGAVIASVPALLLFLFAQRHVIEGVSRTGIKG